MEQFDLRVLQNKFLSRMTTFCIGGMADYLLEVGSVKGLVSAAEFVRARGLDSIVIGKGSKLLVSDSGYRGAVIKPDGLNKIFIDESSSEAYAEGGASLVQLSVLTAEKGLSGLEWATGIPASVGGAVALNAGCYGGDMSRVVTSVEVFDGFGVRTVSAADCRFSYRDSIFLHGGGHIIVGANFKLRPDDPARVQERRREIIKKRAQSQPRGLPSAGSAFKKVGVVSAGELIDRAGLKGFTVGGAQVSPVHANFIVNLGGATCQDVTKLLEYIENTVKDKFGATLECEIIEVGTANATIRGLSYAHPL